jgi:hypothetical protein
LWEFTLRVLKKPKYKYMVSWEKREEGLFRFNNAQAFAAQVGLGEPCQLSFVASRPDAQTSGAARDAVLTQLLKRRKCGTD